METNPGTNGCKGISLPVQFQGFGRGSRSHLGMPPFGGKLSLDDVENIRAYLVKRAHDLKAELAGQ